MNRRRQAKGVVQDAVDAVTHAQMVALGLDVDVGGPVAHGLGQDQVHGAGDGGLRHDVGADGRVHAALAGSVGELAHLLDDLGHIAVVKVDGAVDVGGHGQQRLDALAREGAQRFQGVQVLGVAHGHRERLVGQLKGKDVEPAGGLLGDQPQGLGLHLHALQVHHRQPDLAAEAGEQVGG